ncbi:MAG: hypothetical protein MJ123_01470 [Lachnospiraceae bacterium]|nr:hypothetical protein [Lachnospiraceae bacterium]
MIRNESYLLRKIEDRTFLLPTGQEINWGRGSVELSNIGEIIWEKLKENCSTDDVALAVYNAVTEDCAVENEIVEVAKDSKLYRQIYCDVKTYIEDLAAKGVVNYGAIISDNSEYKYYKIAGIILKICDEKNFIGSFLDDFKVLGNNNGEETVSVYIHETYQPVEYGNGNIIVDSSDVRILEKEHAYEMSFKTLSDINSALVYKEKKIIYLNVSNNSTAENILFAMRLGYTLYALEESKLLIHSASFLYKGKIWLVSAPSGTGKSTHASLWEKYEGVRLINGDSNLLDVDSQTVQGVPWCGTSKICENEDYKLGGIFLLERGTKPEVCELSFPDKVLKVTRRILSPTWDKKMMLHVTDLVEKSCRDVVVAKLVCDMNKESYMVLKEYIDRLSE